MAPKSKKEIHAGGGAAGVSAQGSYMQEIINEVINMDDDGFAFFQHADGGGETMLTKNDGTATAVTTRYGGKSFMARKRGTITTVRIAKEGVDINVREL